MKLKYLQLVFLIAVALSGCQRKYSVEQVSIEVMPNAQLIENGKRLTLSICGPCHYNPDLKNLSGRRMLDVPKAIGRVYAANLTKHPEFGISGYTAGELRFLLKTGIKKNGELSPYMAKPNLADEDIKAIIAFLQSDDDLVKPSENHGKHKYTPMGRLALNKLFDPYKYQSTEIKRPQATDTVALGRYLVDITGCYECHSSNMLKTDRLHPEQSKGYLGGGSMMKTATGKYMRTPNLTFDESGLKDWNLGDFEKALKEGLTKDNKVLSYPMPNYSSLTSGEVEAIYKYLKTVPEIKRKSKAKTTESSPAMAHNGEVLYQKYACINCHGPTGKGIADLTNAYRKYDRAGIKKRISSPVNGSGMPVFEGVIKEEEYSYLIDYVIELGERATVTESARK